MPAKPPRYLLREAAVDRILKGMTPGSFLELGYGSGNMLVHLAGLGYAGTGYDPSQDAREAARALLDDSAIKTVTLAAEFPDDRQFRYIFLFEVIGYLDDPVAYLKALRKNLAQDGMLIFSFTNNRHAGDAEKLSGDMRCFSRPEMMAIVSQAGFECERCINYGYPLSNMLRPLLHRHYRKAGPGASRAAVAASGLQYRKRSFAWSQLVFNRLTMLPFILLQQFFAGSDLGTGYVVVAAPESGHE